MNMKKLILDKWKNKLTYSFTRKDLKELEYIIDYYEARYNELAKQVSERALMIK